MDTPVDLSDHRNVEKHEAVGPRVDELLSALRNLPLAQILSPRAIRLDNFRSDRYRLKSPLMIYLQDRDGYYLAESFDVNQYGEGHSPEDAITMLCEMIEDYYELLLEDEGNLSTVLDRHLQYLRSILVGRE